MSRLSLAIAMVPDVEAGVAIYDLDGLSVDGAHKAMVHLNNQQRGMGRLPLYQYQLVSASVVVEANDGQVQLISLAVEEPQMLETLALLMSEASELITWSGDSRDRPLLAYRYLKHGIVCPAIFDQFSIDSMVHTSLNAELAGVDDSSAMFELAAVIGLPSQKGLEPIDVANCYYQEQSSVLSEACDIDALNTHLISKRLQLTKGELNHSEYQEDCDTLYAYLSESNKAHLRQYATAWRPNNNK